MIKALAFDVFGTVVDWRGTIKAEGRRLFGDCPVAIDWDAFAASWSKAYGESLRAMTDWTNLDVMMAASFYRLASPTGLLQSASLWTLHEMATTWSRLRPWPDAVEGFARLDRYALAAFSNANEAMLESLCESSGLPWSVALSAETVKRYKPDPALYRMVLDELDLPADEVMLVAAHCFDLNAARRCGMRTALIVREGEPGSGPEGLDHEADLIVPDVERLAHELIKRP